jgi:hypothetical protein
MSYQYFIGVDPGSASGGAACLDSRGRIVELSDTDGELEAILFGRSTEHEVANWFAKFGPLPRGSVIAAIEKVRSMPGQGVSATFKFGWSYGFVRGILSAYRIPFEEPTPQVWMKALGCMTGGYKAVSRARAHRQWPDYADRITNGYADALLIAEWLRRTQAVMIAPPKPLRKAR